MSKPDNWAEQGKKYKSKFMNSHTVRSMPWLLKHLVGRQTNIGHTNIEYTKGRNCQYFKKIPDKCLKEIELSFHLAQKSSAAQQCVYALYICSLY